MAEGGTKKPVIFISYSHKGEPEKPRGEEVAWKSYIHRFFKPGIKAGRYAAWVDSDMPGGVDWKRRIRRQLAKCDVFILLASPDAPSSGYILDVEIPAIRKRQENGDGVLFYPIVLTPCPESGLELIKDRNLRPKNILGLSSYAQHDRDVQMVEIEREIVGFFASIAAPKTIAAAPATEGATTAPTLIDIGGLPETGYERLVGREKELAKLDAAWADNKVNILSLIAGAGPANRHWSMNG